MKNLFFIAILAGQIVAQSQFKFAHISDTHIGNATAADDLRRTVKDINAMNDISFVIITGDITEAGSDEQFRLAKQIMDSLNVRWYILPGNHDMKWAESGGVSFKKVFGYERFVFDQEKYRFIGLHQGPRMKMGDGHWAPEDLRWLDSVLAATPKEKPFFIATHYPIDDGIANWYEVLDRVRNYNIRAFLHGHGHRNRADTFEGIAGVMGRSNLRARDSIGGYNIVSISNDTMYYRERIPLISTKPVWQTLSLLNDERMLSTIKKIRPNFAVNDSFPFVMVKWQYHSGYTIASTPAVYNNDAAIVGDASGSVFAISMSSGKNIWSYKTGESVFSSPSIEKDLVVFGSTDSNIYCLNAKNGVLQWRYTTGASVVASPAIRNGVVFIGSSDRKFRALDLNTGKLLWEFPELDGFVESKPTITDGKIVFGAWDEHLYCLDERTGRLIWKWNSDRRGQLLSPAVCEPVVANGKVFIVAPDRFMTAIDLKTGETVWRTNRFQVRESIGSSEDGNKVYVRTMNDSVYALSTEATTPAVIWSLNAQFGYDINSAMLKEKKGTLFYPTKNGLLLAIDSNTGNLKWKYKTGVGVTNTVVALNEKKVLLTDFDGKVMLVESSR